MPHRLYVNEYLIYMDNAPSPGGAYAADSGEFVQCLAEVDSPAEAVQVREQNRQRINQLNADNPPLESVESCPTYVIWIEKRPGASWPLDDTAVMYVNVYEVDRYYGGPEEGGWWYDAGKFIKCLGVTRYLERAERIREDNAEYLAEENEGRPPISSVLSEGQCVIRIEDHPGVDFPQERPFFS